MLLFLSILLIKWNQCGFSTVSKTYRKKNCERETTWKQKRARCEHIPFLYIKGGPKKQTADQQSQIFQGPKKNHRVFFGPPSQEILWLPHLCVCQKLCRTTLGWVKKNISRGFWGWKKRTSTTYSRRNLLSERKNGKVNRTPPDINTPPPLISLDKSISLRSFRLVYCITHKK